MAHTTQEELKAKLDAAKSLVKVGSKYHHYSDSSKLYTVLEVGFLEASEEVAVIYRSEYGENIVWVRVLESFCGEVENNGEKVMRFTLVE